MSKHTPGPWRVDTTKALGAYGVWTAYPTHPGHDGAGYESQICSMMPFERMGDREKRDADAALIAAAPDLLAALKAVLDWQNHTEMQAACVSARAAIAKAEALP